MSHTIPDMQEDNHAVFREISPDEISRLEARGCRCGDWSRIRVEEPFDTGCYRDVEFSGDILLGCAGDMTAEAVGGIPRRCGIYDSVVSGCSVGRSVLISGVRGGLLNLDIAPGAVIDSVYSIVCRGETAFGNDVKVNVMSETGGREVAISVALGAPLAYMMAFYRHSASLSKALDGMAARLASQRRRDRGYVGSGARVVDCGEITNVWIGDGARLRGVTRLTNGTVGRAVVGCGVIARDFIIQDGATVDTGARLQGCLVGHCAEVASGFTAHDTLVFTNSRLENGESAAAFCGPFTTTMHKSTLLIGGLFSFFNAGSGTNQSNHLYKLGPMHQGVLARGCKTGSDSYLMWPAATGPFTTITGRHYHHPDTRRFPFSYLVNDPSVDAGGASVLIPGAAVGSVGLARDVDKWPSRIGGAAEGDAVDFNWLSPYTAQGLLAGLAVLKSSESSQEPFIAVTGAVIPRRSLAKGVANYTLLLKLFLAGVMRRKILAIAATHPEITPASLLERLRERPSAKGSGRWVDMAGLLAPREAVDALAAEIVSDTDMTVEDACRRFDRIKGDYASYSWSWVWHNMQGVAGEDFSALSADGLIRILSEGAEAAARLEEMFVRDAAKEYDVEKASLGFGIDAGDDLREIRDDFERVRGELSGQRFLAQLHRRVEIFRGSIRNIITLLESPLEGVETEK